VVSTIDTRSGDQLQMKPLTTVWPTPVAQCPAMVSLRSRSWPAPEPVSTVWEGFRGYPLARLPLICRPTTRIVVRPIVPPCACRDDPRLRHHPMIGRLSTMPARRPSATMSRCQLTGAPKVFTTRFSELIFGEYRRSNKSQSRQTEPPTAANDSVYWRHRRNSRTTSIAFISSAIYNPEIAQPHFKHAQGADVPACTPGQICGNQPHKEGPCAAQLTEAAAYQTNKFGEKHSWTVHRGLRLARGSRWTI
jgi:hypothetical protein